MADTEIVSGAPEAIRVWGGRSAMKKRKKTGGMFQPSSGYAVMHAKGGGSGMGHATKDPQAKKKKKPDRYPSKPVGGY